MPFLHGVEVVEIDTGPRPIRTARSSIIGLIGTAPDADERWPLHTPKLIAGRRGDTIGLGTTGTLPAAIDDIFDQTGAMIVVIRVPESTAGSPPTLPDGVDDTTGQYIGVSAFLSSESELSITPRILVAPEFTHIQTNVESLLTVAERLRAVVIADGPNTTDTDVIDYRNLFGSPRLYIIDPWVRVFDTATLTEILRPASARVAGLIAKSDDERGFWNSPSNQEIRGIVGPARAVDFEFGDINSRANRLNENEVATIIRKTGFRLWGNRSCSSDPKWAFLSVRRTADIINESLLRAHLWAVDRGITKTYLDDVVEGVNAFLRNLKTQGAIINGQAWADPERNTPERIAEGHVQIDFDFTPPYPAERITFRSQLVNDYLVEVLPLI
ncbi:phage tail sheath C-terminal domain-containing protein [Agarilytica rhodophyticola]|uniref:phage tail sheath C-terminal domain-containing protein n=1 Tax=Agarilytica rhodophyticola TaxID=1737490 RepID=UPI000B34417D|nr:phage tail sheath C-terminal domain-containing protein [Agarilytica rhodophyticola]